VHILNEQSRLPNWQSRKCGYGGGQVKGCRDDARLDRRVAIGDRFEGGAAFGFGAEAPARRAIADLIELPTRRAERRDQDEANPECLGIPAPRDNAPLAEGARFIGTSVAACHLRDMIARLARTNATTLIQGPTGTGKEVVALLLHRNSPRHAGPLVPVNCAAIPDAMVEGELFGYEKGAFTGAVRAYPGKFGLADGGTLFLDEVGELPPCAQAKVLRAIESREVFPLGGQRPRRFQARIIAATNRDLAAEVAAGRFRADLYYRLAVVQIEIPPLSERRSDISAIARHLLCDLGREMGCPPPRLSAMALVQLEARDWPGNVRELRNALEHAMVVAADPRAIEPCDLPPPPCPLREENPVVGLVQMTGERPAPDLARPTETECLRDAILASGGKKAAAARLLNVSRTTLYRRMQRLGLPAAEA
jgi:DNA-binding NtrC family response regulator